MIHHPLDFAMETSPTVFLAPQRETFVVVHPTDLRCSDQVLALPETQRKCINPSEYDYVDPYRQSSCILDCIRANVHQTCECHPFYLPEKAIYGRNKPIRECSLVDGLCLVKNYGGLDINSNGGWRFGDGLIVVSISIYGNWNDLCFQRNSRWPTVTAYLPAMTSLTKCHPSVRALKTDKITPSLQFSKLS